MAKIALISGWPRSGTTFATDELSLLDGVRVDREAFRYGADQATQARAWLAEVSADERHVLAIAKAFFPRREGSAHLSSVFPPCKVLFMRRRSWDSALASIESATRRGSWWFPWIPIFPASASEIAQVREQWSRCELAAESDADVWRQAGHEVRELFLDDWSQDPDILTQALQWIASD